MRKSLVERFLTFLGIRKIVQVGRNSPCPCGSGLKYKKCHLDKDESQLADERESAAAADRNYFGGKATVGNRALDNINRYKKPKPR